MVQNTPDAHAAPSSPRGQTPDQAADSFLVNWLAHVALAADADDGRLLGNLAGDFMRGADPTRLAADLRRGIDDHRAVDRLTDDHPATRSAFQRLAPALGRYAGVAVDVWFDHVLARRWEDWYPTRTIEALEQRLADALDTRIARAEPLPARLVEHGPRLLAEGVLSSYRDASGAERALQRIARRARRTDNPLAGAAEALHAEDGALAAAFARLFPTLQDLLRERLGAGADRRGPNDGYARNDGAASGRDAPTDPAL
jgi:acyl carrier protein phosphodiesterase